MVKQYLSSIAYVYEKRFVIPSSFGDDQIGYEIFHGEGLVKCFSCNKGDVGKAYINNWIVPEKARTMEFSKMEISGKFIPGAPLYYDRKGDILRIGNRVW